MRFMRVPQAGQVPFAILRPFDSVRPYVTGYSQVSGRIAASDLVT
jgi:hypothetical protein